MPRDTNRSARGGERRRSRLQGVLRWLIRGTAFGALFVLGMWAGLVTAAFPSLDDLERQAEFRQLPGAIVAADDRTVLRKLVAPETRTYVEPEQLTPLLIAAVTTAEDRRFLEHSGIDPRGLVRAALADVRARATVQGGSTITQQLVKNAYVGPEQTLGRKSREAILAVALETRWSKDRILAAYLNTAYFGSGHYGIADAASGYFRTPIKSLTPAQAALLAALLRAPEGNNPTTEPMLAKAARDRVLTAMAARSQLTDAQLRVATAAVLLPRRPQSRRTGRREIAPHVADAVVADLIKRYGVRRALGGGLRVRTTIDAQMQRAANNAVARVNGLGLDAALVAIDPKTGEVRAMTQGGTVSRAAFNVALSGRRQPGSAFKPFMLAAAYEGGYSPTTPLLSAPFDKTYDGTRFRVTNGGGYAGVTSLERATWQSDNTVYARLQDTFGIQSAITAARAAGVTSRMDPVPALVLGALPYGTTPTELAHAYATFAAHGSRTSMSAGGGPRYLARVTARDGSTWRPKAIRRQALDAGVADLVTSTLRGVIDSGTGTGAALGRPAAGKTGTTERYRDAWFVGYTPTLVTAVWVGHVEGGISMNTENAGGPVTGGSIPADIWRTFMTAALDGKAVANFTLRKPRFVTVTVDPGSSLLAGLWCAGAVEAAFIAGKEPTQTSTTCTPKLRPAPDLVGLALEDARALLAHEQFAAATREKALVSRADRDGVVISQRPPAGTEISQGDAIALVVGDYPFSR